jgi:hypothetical protein
MTQPKAILLASLAAVLVQPLVFLVWIAPPALLDGEPAVLVDMARVSILAAVVAVPFVLIVGVPATLLLLRYNKLRWWPLALIGFVAAALPIALLGLQSSPGYSSGGNWHGKAVEYVINGKLTFYGWLSYFESLVGYGTQGLVGASAFYIVWRRSMGPNNSFKPKPLRGSA